ncbi:transposase [Flavobacterium flavigenum]|uniref:transposase n=1 Tax=Flavobacterium flavigenum TaxID=3003258 RepID=UPI0022ABD5DF|nr:transposase [Flavobacterium flavigenum]
MKKYLFYVGIDVSKAKLDINILDSLTLKSEHFIIENNIESISIFIKKLDTKVDKKCTLFCCENTGVYTNHLSSVLVKINLDLWIVPAIEIKKSKGISRGKNDKTDAKDISYYSYRNIDKLKLYTFASLDIQKLKMLYTEREKMVKALMLIQATKESKEFTKKIVFKEVSQINQTLVKSIKISIHKIESKIKEVIKANDQLNKQSQLIRSIPGLGEQTSVYLIIATKGFTAFKTWRQFACYSGVAPFEHSSGSSVKGRTRVNHMADKKMKSLLQMCAMTTLKYDSQLKEYYNKKKVEGKNSMLVLNNIRCKLISRVFAVINRETPYINTYKFAS